MSKEIEKVKGFVFNGLLTSRELEELGETLLQLDSPLVNIPDPTDSTDPSWYPPDLVEAAQRMTQVYFRLYLFENQARRLIRSVMEEAKGPDWFNNHAPDGLRTRVQKRQEAEEYARFHSQRGDDSLEFLTLPELGRIIEHNWEEFADILYRREWMLSKFEELRLTRNATAHMGVVADDDLKRLDVILNDWIRQVG